MRLPMPTHTCTCIERENNQKAPTVVAEHETTLNTAHTRISCSYSG